MPRYQGPNRDLSDCPRFVHVHIPKTAGNTVRRILVEQFDGCKVKQLNNPDTWASFRALPVMEKLTYDVLTGHLPCGFDETLPRRFNYITILRHPVSRVISHFTALKYLDNQTPVTRTIREKDMSLIDFVTETDQAFFPWQFSQLFYLGWSVTPVKSIEVLVERAFQRLVGEIAFFGLQEAFLESMACLEHRFGFNVTVAPKNVTPEEAKIEVSEKDKDRLHEVLAPEIELYELARKIFDLRIGEVPNLAFKVETLRAKERTSELSPKVW